MYIIISRADVRLCCCCCCRIPAKSKDYYCTYRDFQTTAADFGRSGPPSIVPGFWFSSNPPPIHPLNYTPTAGALRFFFREFHIICLIFWRPFSYIVMTSQPYTVGFRSIDRFVYIIILYYIPLCMCICICTQSSILLDNIIHSQIVCTVYTFIIVAMSFLYNLILYSLQTFYSFCSHYNFYRYNFHYENNDND